jgi:hypothetical protein
MVGNIEIVGFEVLSSGYEVSIFWDLAVYSVESQRRLGGKRLLHLQGRRISGVGNQGEEVARRALGFLLVLFFDPEGGSNAFLRNVAWPSTDYTALCRRRSNI